MVSMRWVMLVMVAAVSFCGCVREEPPPTPTSVPSLEDFEKGTVQLKQVKDGDLELFIQASNRWKDADFAAHDGQGGPDSARLWPWIDGATKELQARGYTIDEKGGFYRPDGSSVDWR